jgi:glucose 1-dehydrogenase
MTNRLDGNIAIVTGFDSGMGQAMAEEFAKEGADAAIVYLQDRARRPADELRRRDEPWSLRQICARNPMSPACSIKQGFIGASGRGSGRR